tara:strand:+ start:633 stop:1094 length:462 start_codon:yes stop_codon:yes gene_type:complete
LLSVKLKLLKNTGNENVSEKIFTERKLDELFIEKSDRGLAKKIFELLQDSKAEEIVLIDVRDSSNLADYIFICEGRSQIHCRGIAEKVMFHLKHQGCIHLGIEGEHEGNWVLLDYGNIILHVFHPEVRKYYNLEELYAPYQEKDGVNKNNPAN